MNRPVPGGALPLAAASADSGVFDVPGHADLVAKVFRGPCPPGRAERLRHLIELPDAMSAAERDILRTASCWPLAALVDQGGDVVGCLLPKAPEKFVFDRTTPSGRTHAGYLEIDWLANPDDVLERRGIPPQDMRSRAAVCRSITTVAAVLERHDLVYSDWSYSNAFWCVEDHSAYVIDVDGCAPHSSPNVQQPGWEDPLTPSTSAADKYVDRYRLALLAARCLTGRRRADHVVHALGRGTDGLDGAPGLRTVLLRMLLSPEREQRPSAHQLLVELVAAAEG